MPFIETKVICPVCQGQGSSYPLGTFNPDESKKRDCINCDGLGHFIHQILVNPIKDEQKAEKDNYVASENVNELIDETPKKSKKKDKEHVV